MERNTGRKTELCVVVVLWNIFGIKYSRKYSVRFKWSSYSLRGHRKSYWQTVCFRYQIWFSFCKKHWSWLGLIDFVKKNYKINKLIYNRYRSSFIGRKQISCGNFWISKILQFIGMFNLLNFTVIWKLKS